MSRRLAVSVLFLVVGLVASPGIAAKKRTVPERMRKITGTIANPSHGPFRLVAYATKAVSKGGRAGSRAVPIPKADTSGVMQQVTPNLSACKWAQCQQASTAQSGEEGWHQWDTWHWYDSGGRHLFDTEWYVRFYTDTARTKVVRVERVDCQDFEVGSQRNWDCNSQTTGEGAGGGWSERATIYHGYHRNYCPGACPHWEYRVLFNITMDANHQIVGRYDASSNATW